MPRCLAGRSASNWPPTKETLGMHGDTSSGRVRLAPAARITLEPPCPTRCSLHYANRRAVWAGGEPHYHTARDHGDYPCANIRAIRFWRHSASGRPLAIGPASHLGTADGRPLRAGGPLGLQIGRDDELKYRGASRVVCVHSTPEMLLEFQRCPHFSNLKY
jgi:hypothetical protein